MVLCSKELSVGCNLNLYTKPVLISVNDKTITHTARSITKKRATLFFILVIKKTRIIVKIKDKYADLENVENQARIESTVKIPNVIFSHKNTLTINIPKETGIIKLI